MDPLSISAGAAGFLGLTIQIGQILKDYISGVHSAAEEAQNLLREAEVLTEVLKRLMELLGSDDLQNQTFEKASVLCVAISSGRSRMEMLYAKLFKISDAYSGNKLKQLITRIKWPLQKEECQQIIVDIQRSIHTFKFALEMSTWYVMGSIVQILKEIV